MRTPGGSGVFQLPTFAFFLARLGLVTAAWLWRNFCYAILVIFIVAAVLTPSPSPTDQIVFAAPMIVLYVLSIGIAWMAAPRRGAAERLPVGSTQPPVPSPESSPEPRAASREPRVNT